MKKLIALASIAALAACSQAEAPAPEPETVVDEPAAVAGGPGGPGTFEVTYADGSVGTMTSTAEGTYTASVGEETQTGMVAEADGKVCFDPEGDEPETMCWTNSEVGEDGSFQSTADDGEIVTVRRTAG